MSLPRVQTD